MIEKNPHNYSLQIGDSSDILNFNVILRYALTFKSNSDDWCPMTLAIPKSFYCCPTWISKPERRRRWDWKAKRLKHVETWFEWERRFLIQKKDRRNVFLMVLVFWLMPLTYLKRISSLAAEHKYLEDVSLTPTGCWAFFSSYLFSNLSLNRPIKKMQQS